MSDRSFISSETAFEFIGRMLEEPVFAGRVNEDALDAFEDMRDKGNPLTAKQLLWVQGIAVQLGMVEEPAQNEWSSKTLQERERIRGKDVPTPAVLLDKPLRPPHRRHELED